MNANVINKQAETLFFFLNLYDSFPAFQFHLKQLLLFQFVRNFYYKPSRLKTTDAIFSL